MQQTADGHRTFLVRRANQLSPGRGARANGGPVAIATRFRKAFLKGQTKGAALFSPGK